MITAICQECNKQFDYDLKPGFPRKYCPECSAKKKSSYEDMQNPQNVPVVKPGFITQGRAMGKSEIPTLPVQNKHATMYVSYAKDLIVAGKTPEEAIQIINVLKDTFS